MPMKETIFLGNYASKRFLILLFVQEKIKAVFFFQVEISGHVNRKLT